MPPRAEKNKAIQVHDAELYAQFEYFFAQYPMAVESFADPGEPDAVIIREMVLVRPDRKEGGAAAFAVVTWHSSTEGRPFRVSKYDDPSARLVIRRDGLRAGDQAPAWITFLEAAGVPLPADGSLFGWKNAAGDRITGLIAFYTTSRGAGQLDPAFSPMPEASVPQAEWPDFLERPEFGEWFWDETGRGRMVRLDDLVAGTEETVLWVTYDTFAYGAIRVERDVADAIADAIVVLAGTAVVYGIPLDAVLPAVHASNMTKANDPDSPKLLKLPGRYEPPRVAEALGAGAR